MQQKLLDEMVLHARYAAFAGLLFTPAAVLAQADSHVGHEHTEQLEATPMHEFDEFVITATRTERLVTDVPVQTEVYTPEKFAQYNVTNLSDALELVPSARFENDCQNCGLNQIQLLGLSTDYTAILFDGAPLYSGLAKVYGADLFPSIFVDRIEIVKGGGSVLYGPEAIAGVVNLITDEPFRTGGELRYGMEYFDVGNEAEHEVSAIADYVSDDGTFAASVYGLYVQREGMDLTTDGFTEIPEFENKVGGVQLWWYPQEDARLKVNYQILDEAHRGGDRLDLPVIQSRVAEALEHQVHMARLAWEQEISKQFDYQISNSFSYTNRESFYGARANSELLAYQNGAGVLNPAYDPETMPEPADYQAFIAANQAAVDAQARQVFGDTDNYVYFFDSQGNYRIGDHTFSAGFQFRYELLEDSTPNNPAQPDTTDDFANAGFFLQDQWMITDKLEIVPGVRLDHHDNVDDLVFSPRIAARYSATDDLTLRASYSTGFNAPGAFNEDAHIGVTNGGAIVLRNAPGLQEESSQTLSFGIEYRPEIFGNDTILLTQLHHTWIEDTFDIDDSADPLWVRVNGSDSTVLVWENVLNYWFADHWFFNGSVTYTQARYETPQNRVTGLITKEYLETPNLTALLGLNYENDDLFDAFVLASFTGQMVAVGEDADIYRDTPDFWEIDLGLSKTFDISAIGDVTLSLGIKNLLDDRQKDIDNAGENRDVTYFYGPTRPRSYYFSISSRF